MRETLLVRHFLWRFLEHDLISTSTDRRVTLSVFAGTLLAGSLFVTMLIGLYYQFAPDMPAGMVSVSSLDDRFTLGLDGDVGVRPGRRRAMGRVDAGDA
jgi:hypothetical protein